MPQAVLGPIASFVIKAGAGLAGAFGAGAGASLAFGVGLWNTAVYGAGMFALSALSKKLAPDFPSASQEAGATLYTINSTVEPRRIIYGQTLVSGLRTYASVTGTNNEYLWTVITVAGHECEDITDIWLDQDVIADADISDAPNINPSDYNNVTGSTDYVGYLGIQRMLGSTSQIGSTWLTAADSTWDSNHRGRGVAYIIACYTYADQDADPNPWKSVPSNIRALVKGKKVYDMRLDTTNGGSGSHRYDDPATWAWSENPALCLRDYLIDTDLGLGISNDQIDDVLMAAAANTCEETVSLPSGSEDRYTCNGIAHTGMTPAQIIHQILTSMQGTIVYRDGKFRVYAGEYHAPTVTLTEDDLAGPIQIKPRTPRNDLFNAVQATYTEPAQSYQVMEASLASNSTYQTDDGGKQYIDYISLPMTNSETMAQRIAIQRTEFSRMQTYVNFPAKPSAYQLACHDTVTLDMPSLGWSASESNDFTYSYDFTNAFWTKTNCTATANAATAPDGTLTASLMTEDSTASAEHYIAHTQTAVVGDVYTYEFSVKRGPGNRDFLLRVWDGTAAHDTAAVLINLDDGSESYTGGFDKISHGIEPEGNGWYRLWATFKAESTSPSMFLELLENETYAGYNGDGTSGVYLWGASFKAGYRGKYWPTNGTAFTGATKIMRVVGTDFSQDGRNTLNLREESSAVYTDPQTGDYGTPGVPATLTFGAQAPPAPTSVGVTGYANHVVVTWTPPLSTLYDYVEVYSHTSNDASLASRIGVGAQDTLVYYPSTTSTLYYWTRAVNNANRKSSWSPAQTSGIPAAITAVSGAEATVVLSGLTLTPSLGTITVQTGSGYTVALGSDKSKSGIDISSPYDVRSGFKLDYNANTDGFMAKGACPTTGGAITSWTDVGDICSTTGYTSSDFEYQWVEVSATNTPTKNSPVAASTWEDFNGDKTWYASSTSTGTRQWVIDVTVREKADTANTDTVRVTMDIEASP